jgi:hypothetical protein
MGQLEMPIKAQHPFLFSQATAKLSSVVAISLDFPDFINSSGAL